MNTYDIKTGKESLYFLYKMGERVFDEQQYQIWYKNVPSIFDPDEDVFGNPLDYENFVNKKVEENIRSSNLALASEYFLKYLLLAYQLNQNPNLTREDLWDSSLWPNLKKGIKMHDLSKLFTILDDKMPGIKDDIFKIMEINSLNEQMLWQGIGMPIWYLQDQTAIVFEENNKSIYEDYCNNHINTFETARYFMENNDFRDGKEIYWFARNLAFVCKMIRSNNDSFDIDYKVAYLKAKLETDITISLAAYEVRNKEQRDRILNMSIVKDDVSLLYELLTNNTIDLDEIEHFIMNGHTKEEVKEKVLGPEYVLSMIESDDPYEKEIKAAIFEEFSTNPLKRVK